MATGAEQGLLLVARLAAGSVILVLFGLLTYGAGGYLVLVETVELTYPFMDVNRDPVLNFFLTLAGIGMFVTSLPLLLLATVLSHDAVDADQVILTTILGALGLVLVRTSVFNIV